MEDKRRIDERQKAERIAQELALTKFEVLSNETMTERIIAIVRKASPYLFSEIYQEETKEIKNPYSKEPEKQKASKSITDAEKKVLFDYLAIPSNLVYEQTGETLEQYAHNVILIINCFFDYGYLQNDIRTHYWATFRNKF